MNKTLLPLYIIIVYFYNFLYDNPLLFIYIIIYYFIFVLFNLTALLINLSNFWVT